MMNKLKYVSNRATNLATVVGANGTESNAIPNDLSFTITLHHGESFIIRNLPVGPRYLLMDRRM